MSPSVGLAFDQSFSGTAPKWILAALAFGWWPNSSAMSLVWDGPRTCLEESLESWFAMAWHLSDLSSINVACPIDSIRSLDQSVVEAFSLLHHVLSDGVTCCASNVWCFGKTLSTILLTANRHLGTRRFCRYQRVNGSFWQRLRVTWSIVCRSKRWSGAFLPFLQSYLKTSTDKPSIYQTIRRIHFMMYGWQFMGHHTLHRVLTCPKLT